QIDELKGNEDDLYTVQNLLQNDLCNLHKELLELNESIISLMDEEEMIEDQKGFDNKLTSVKDYMETSLTWVWEEIKRKEKAPRADVPPEPDEVQADDM